MERSTLARRLTVAVSNLIVDDWRLLTLQARGVDTPLSERAVACALSWHVRGVMERSWDIDCEYNRALHGDDAVIKRRDGGVSVVPDLIVHRRGERDVANSLLVLELKTNDMRQGHVGGSKDSIAQVRRMHGYQHSVYLDLRVAPDAVDPHWSWVADDSPVLERVYRSPRALAALCDRGREEERRRYPTPR